MGHRAAHEASIYYAPQTTPVTRDYRKPLFILGAASFGLFVIILDYLAYKFRVPHRSWAPGAAVGLAATVVLLARAWFRRPHRDGERD